MQLTIVQLFLAINILDRFAEKSKVARNQLQLVGVTAMLIAAKYEDGVGGTSWIKTFEFMCGGAYTSKMILDMEMQICNKLSFNFTVATPYTFLQCYCNVAAPEGNDIVILTVCYLLELTACQYASLRHRPSLLAATAVHLACKMYGLPSWTPTLQHHTGYSESDMHECASEMNDCHRKALQATAQAGTSLRAAFRKYSAACFKALRLRLRSIFPIYSTALSIEPLERLDIVGSGIAAKVAMRVVLGEGGRCTMSVKQVEQCRSSIVKRLKAAVLLPTRWRQIEFNS